MGKITRKQQRKLSVALDGFFKPKSILIPKSLDDFRSLSDVLSRELRLDKNRVLLMTDMGMVHFRTIVSTLHEADVFEGLAAYSDVGSACRKLLEKMLIDGEMPDDGGEFCALVQQRVAADIDLRTYAVPLFGVNLVEIESLQLGAMRIVRAGRAMLDAAGVKHDFAAVDGSMEVTKIKLWLVGSVMGTERIAEERFRMQAELAVGMLALSAAARYERGATAFRIGVVMSPEQAYGRSAWYSWSERKRDLTTHYSFVKSQPFEIGVELAQQFDDAGVFQRAFEILQKQNTTPLEGAFTRAVYWYSDAHREDLPVMKLIKYWSCVESFFTANNKDVTNSVSVGLATALVFGDFDFAPVSAYAELKQRIVKLYNLRSRALHGAMHQHVKSKDAADLSQWVAWMLINMVALIEKGYSQFEQLKEQCDRLDRQASGDAIRTL